MQEPTSESISESFSQLVCVVKASYKMFRKQKPILKETKKLIDEGKVSDEMAAHYELVLTDGKVKGQKRPKGRTNVESMQYLIDFAADLEENVALYPASVHDNIAVYVGCIEQVQDVAASMDAEEAAKKARKAEILAKAKARKAEKAEAKAEPVEEPAAEEPVAEAAQPAADEPAEKDEKDE